MRKIAKVKVALLLASVVFWIVYGYFFSQLYAYAQSSATHWLYIRVTMTLVIIVFGVLDTVIITDYTLNRLK